MKQGFIAFIALLVIIALGAVFLIRAEKHVESRKDFTYQSLKGQSYDEILKFMGGRDEDTSFPKDGEESLPTSFPEQQWLKNPKATAIQYVAANRKAKDHREKTVRFSNDANVPTSGWLVYNGSSASCYSFSSSITAIRFGIDHPYLIVTGSNSNGVVGRNPYLDRVGSSFKIIPLSQKEATFLAQLIHYLANLHLDIKNESEPSVFSTGDGFATLRISNRNDPAQEVDGRIWYERSIADRWGNFSYDKDVAINLIHYLLTDELPKQLKERWPQEDAGHRYIGTPMEERLKPHETEEMRKMIATNVATALKLNQTDPLPSEVLEQVITIAGQLGFVDTLPAIQSIEHSLSVATEQETEYSALKKQFETSAKSWSKKEIEDNYDARSILYNHLSKKSEFILRKSISTAGLRLQTINHPEALVQMAEEDGKPSLWALQQLQLKDPKSYSEVVISKFRDPSVDLKNQKMLFDALAAVYPTGALHLSSTLNEQEQHDLIFQLTELEITHRPGAAKSRVSALLSILEDPSKQYDSSSRGTALNLLSKIPLDQKEQDHFQSLMIAEMKSPRVSGYGSGIIRGIVTVISALPNPEKHWDDLLNLLKIKDTWNRERIMDLLAQITANDSEHYRSAYFNAFNQAFKDSNGSMNDLFMMAIAMDFREFMPNMISYATLSPTERDGENARSSGGDFQGPAGQYYHLARHAVALWQEQDPETLAQMWTAFAANHLDDFSSKTFTAKKLQEYLKASLGKTSQETREALVEKLRLSANQNNVEQQWIDSLLVP